MAAQVRHAEGLCTPDSHVLPLLQGSRELKCLCGYLECCNFHFNNRLLSVLLNQKSYCYIWIILTYSKLRKNVSIKPLCPIVSPSSLGEIVSKQALHEY